MSKNSLEIDKKGTCFIIFALGSNKWIRGSPSLGSPDMSTVSEYYEFYKQNLFHMDLICKKWLRRDNWAGHQCVCGGIV